METKDVYRVSDTLFNNSQCLFIEYHDVIAMPWFTLLTFTKNTELFADIFKINEISIYDLTGLLEWYIYRKHRNILKSIGTNDTINLDDKAYDEMLSKCMLISDDLYRIPTNLKFLSILRLLLSEKSIVKEVIIYSEHDEPMIETTLSQYFSNYNKVKYVYGNFADIIKTIPNDSTYVLSDIEKINILVQENKLNLSSILVANGLRYNYMIDDQNKLKIDLDELNKTYVFKYSFFDNFDLRDSLENGVLPSEIQELHDNLNTDK